MDGGKVYFQPPESIKLTYPCIIYKFMGVSTLHADNIKYKNAKRYEVTLIDKNPDSAFYEALLELAYCSFDRTFVNDNLHHYVYTIYY